MAKLKPPAVPEQPVPSWMRRRCTGAAGYVCAGREFESRRDTALILLRRDAGLAAQRSRRCSSRTWTSATTSCGCGARVAGTASASGCGRLQGCRVDQGLERPLGLELYAVQQSRRGRRDDVRPVRRPRAAQALLLLLPPPPCPPCLRCCPVPDGTPGSWFARRGRQAPSSSSRCWVSARRSARALTCQRGREARRAPAIRSASGRSAHDLATSCAASRSVATRPPPASAPSSATASSAHSTSG